MTCASRRRRSAPTHPAACHVGCSTDQFAQGPQDASGPHSLVPGDTHPQTGLTQRAQRRTGIGVQVLLAKGPPSACMGTALALFVQVKAGTKRLERLAVALAPSNHNTEHRGQGMPWHSKPVRHVPYSRLSSTEHSPTSNTTARIMVSAWNTQTDSPCRRAGTPRPGPSGTGEVRQARGGRLYERPLTNPDHPASCTDLASRGFPQEPRLFARAPMVTPPGPGDPVAGAPMAIPLHQRRRHRRLRSQDDRKRTDTDGQRDAAGPQTGAGRGRARWARPRCCSRRAARTWRTSPRPRPGSGTRAWPRRAGPASSRTPKASSSRSPGCAATSATTAPSSPSPASCAGRATGCSCRPDEVLDIARRGRRTGLQGSPVHPRRQARGPLARGARVARRARLRRHARLRPRHGDPRPGGDRACCPTSTRACCPGPTSSGSSPSRPPWA